MFKKLRLFLFLPLLLGLFGCSGESGASSYETQVIKRISDFNKSKTMKTKSIGNNDVYLSVNLEFIKYIDYGVDQWIKGSCSSNECSYQGGATVKYEILSDNNSYNKIGFSEIYMFVVKILNNQETIEWRTNENILNLFV